MFSRYNIPVFLEKETASSPLPSQLKLYHLALAFKREQTQTGSANPPVGLRGAEGDLRGAGSGGDRASRPDSDARGRAARR